MTESDSLALYIHIPFCETRCSYCAFTSQPTDQTPLGQVDRYLHALQTELNRSIQNRPIASLFIGGGTPSLLTPTQLRQLCESLRKTWLLTEDIEWSIEMNPGSINAEFIETAVEQGINRFSVGVQSFTPQTLEQLQRKHDRQDITQTMRTLRECGAQHVNLDLIYGVPNQTFSSFREDLSQLMELSPDHVSLYNLQFEEGTGLRDQLDRGLIADLEEETQLQMYRLACSTCKTNGMPQYEISSFAAHENRCRHNLTYWQNREYIGVGAGAYGFMNETRYRNHCGVGRYIEAVEAGDTPKAEVDYLKSDQILIETLITGLRLRDGVNWIDLNQNFGAEQVLRLQEICEGHEASGFMENLGEGKIRLTEEGVLVSNSIFETLVSP